MIYLKWMNIKTVFIEESEKVDFWIFRTKEIRKRINGWESYEWIKENKNENFHEQ